MEQAFNRLETEYPGLGESISTDGLTQMSLVTPRLSISVYVRALAGDSPPMVRIGGLHGRAHCLHRHVDLGDQSTARVYGLSVSKIGNPECGVNYVIWDAHLHLSGNRLTQDAGEWTEMRDGDKYFEVMLVTGELETLMRALLNAPDRAVTM